MSRECPGLGRRPRRVRHRRPTGLNSPVGHIRLVRTGQGPTTEVRPDCRPGRGRLFPFHHEVPVTTTTTKPDVGWREAAAVRSAYLADESRIYTELATYLRQLGYRLDRIIRREVRWLILTESLSVCFRRHWFPWWGRVTNTKTGVVVYTAGILLLGVSIRVDGRAKLVDRG